MSDKCSSPQCTSAQWQRLLSRPDLPSHKTPIQRVTALSAVNNRENNPWDDECRGKGKYNAACMRLIYMVYNWMEKAASLTRCDAPSRRSKRICSTAKNIMWIQRKRRSETSCSRLRINIGNKVDLSWVLHQSLFELHLNQDEQWS